MSDTPDTTESANKGQPWDRVIAKAEPKFTEIAALDGNLVTFKREAMFAHQIITAGEYLQKCTPDSIFNAIVNVASVGLSLSPAEKLAYLVPRKLKKSDRDPVCCLDISYRGLKKIAEDSGSVVTAVAEIVREADEFEWIDKLSKPRHRFDPFAPRGERGDYRGVYCMALLPSGVYQVEPLSMEDIAKIRAFSKAENGPWIEWTEEMMKKSAVRRGSKMWPHSRRMQVANAILDEHQGLLDPITEAPAAPQLEGPSAHSEPAPPPAPASSSGEPPAPQDAKAKKQSEADAKPIQPGQVRILKAKAKSAEVPEPKLYETFGPVETWKFGDFQRIQKWIGDQHA